MFITPVYSCRNCKKTYSGSKQEIANVPIEKLVSAARYTLGGPDHIFRIGGKTIQRLFIIFWSCIDCSQLLVKLMVNFGNPRRY